MRRKITLALFILAGYFLQTAVFPALPLSATPNILLSIAVFSGILAGRKTGMVAGFAGGLLLDLYYGDVLGFYALFYLLAGYISGRYFKVFFEERAVVPVLLSGALDIICAFVIYITRFFLRGRIFLPGYIMRVILPEAFMTALAAILLYRVYFLLDRAARRSDEKRKHVSWLQE